MSVTSWEEIADNGGGEGAIEVNADGVETRTYTRAFRATVSSNSDTAATVLAYSGCPRSFAPHPGDPWATARSRRAVRDRGKRIFIVTVTYSSESQSDEGARGENPLGDPAVITGGTQSYTRVYRQDRDGHAITNSAGDPFSDPVEGDDSRWLMKIVKNVATIPTWIDEYRDAVNSDAITFAGRSWAAGTLKLMSVSFSEPAQRNGTWYRVLTMDIAVDENGWAVKPLDQGFRQKFIAVRLPIASDDGRPVTSPALLNGSGAAIADPESSDGVYLTYNIYKSKPFSVLPLR